MSEETKKCFIISPIGEKDSDTRKRADRIYNSFLKPVLKKCGYETVRADEIPEPGKITVQVIEHIFKDPLVIADLTGGNPNVFYELAIRHFIGKPFIQIIEEQEKIPFDIYDMRTIHIDYTSNKDKTRNEIKEQIKAIEDKPPEEIVTPISVAVDYLARISKEKLQERYYGEMLNAINDIKTKFEDFIEGELKNEAGPMNIYDSHGIFRGRG